MKNPRQFHEPSTQVPQELQSPLSQSAEVPQSVAATGVEPPKQPTRSRMDTTDLKRRAGRGALWNLAGSGVQVTVRLGASTILARTLYPEAFGIVGMAMLVQNLIQQFGNLGMATGLIAKKDITDDDLSTAFWTTLCVRTGMFLVAFFASPWCAVLFDTRELTWVLRVTSIGFLISAVSSTSATLLKKRLQFGASTIIATISTVVGSGLGVYFAVWLKLDYWSLVLATLLGSTGGSVLTILYVGWWPKFRFNRESFKFLFNYGINGLGQTIGNYFHQNIDYLVVGKMLGPATLGLYEFAYRLPHLAQTHVGKTVGSVLFPTLSQVQSDPKQVMAGYVKTAQYISLVTFPALFGLAALAHPTVLILWGERWLPIVVPMQILCFAAVSRSVGSPIGVVYLCIGRPDIPTKFTWMRLVVTVPAVAVFGYMYGLLGVAIGMAVSVVPVVVIICIAARLTDTSPRRVLMALAPAFVASGACALTAIGVYAAFQVLEVNVIMAWSAAILSGATVYAASLWKVSPEVTSDLLATVRIVLKQRSESLT